MLDISLSTGYKKRIDRDENSILIIGKAKTEYRNKEIIQYSSIEEVEDVYGESDLTTAFKEAKEIGAEKIFLCNCYKYVDYIEILNQIENRNFSYITPLFNFSETFITDGNKKMYLPEIYSNILNDKLVQIIMTDQHASLFENLQHFVDIMNSINNDFKRHIGDNFYSGSNLCFVLNNLKEYKFANVALASILTQNSLRDYPTQNLGDVVFDVNSQDFFNQELAYFVYDDLAKTSIENFLNYHNELSPEKFVLVNLIKQKILRALDFSEYAGSLYNPYLKLQLENKINETMQKFVGDIIERYIVHEFIISSDEEGMIIITIPLTIKPYNSIESFDLSLEV